MQFPGSANGRHCSAELCDLRTRQKQLTGGRACLAYNFGAYLLVHMSLCRAPQNYVMEGSYAHPSGQEAGNKTGCGQGQYFHRAYSPLPAFSSQVPPPKVFRTFQNSVSSWGQSIHNMSLWRTFLVQTIKIDFSQIFSHSHSIYKATL